ncbi:MAG TPA: hypothetical protein DCZ72_02250 [Armatimonadetes bacterium]|nr:hypothetical protein [Armatimonadota bacterium]
MRLPDFRRWFGRRRAPQGTREEALALQPVRNPAIEWTVQDSGLVLLTVPLARRGWLKVASVLVPAPESKGVELDEVGSAIWQWCDGQTPVAELVARLTAEHRLNAREAEVSLTQFLQTLAKRRFIGLQVAPEELAAAEGEGAGEPAPGEKASGPTVAKEGSRARGKRRR